MLANANCVLCDADEQTREQLFFKCPKSATCLLQLREWLGWKSNAGDLIGVLRWIQRAKVSRFKKQVYVTMIAALVYCIWQHRNMKLWQQVHDDEDAVIHRVKTLVKLRVKMIDVKCNAEECNWFIEL